MQRSDPEGIVISCDFCLRDWDGQEPMVEGHHGSVLCIPCLERAMAEKKTADSTPPPISFTSDDSIPPTAPTFQCTLCLQEKNPILVPHWSHPESKSPAVLCESCIKLAARTFSKSPLTDWTHDPKA